MKKLITLLFSLSLLCSSDLFLKTQASFITETRPSIQYEWKKEGKGWWYKNPDGSYPKNTWQKISGKWYHFDSNGYMQIGWLKDSGQWYYLNSSGAMVKGWQKISKKWYYFNGSGMMVSGPQKIDGKLYYFRNDGDMLANIWLTLNNTSRYYLASSGAAVTGWYKLNNKWYYFNKDGIMQTGWQTIGGKKYYLKPSGEMVTGTMSLDGMKYTFNSSGALVSQEKTGIWKQNNGQWYYQKPDNTNAKGWEQVDNKWYHFTNDGVMQTGWQTINGKKYYLKSSGAMATGWQYIGSNWYYFNDSGSMRTGWFQPSGKKYWYYLEPGTGIMVANKNRTINGKTYEFLSNGVMYDRNLVISIAKSMAGKTGSCEKMAYELTKNSLGMGGCSASTDPNMQNYFGKAHKISLSQARPGDLIVYRKSDGSVPHVGVYLTDTESFQGNWNGSVHIVNYRHSNYYGKKEYQFELWRIDCEYDHPGFYFVN